MGYYAEKHDIFYNLNFELMKHLTQDTKFINYFVRFFAVLKQTDDYEIIGAENIKINVY